MGKGNRYAANQFVAVQRSPLPSSGKAEFHEAQFFNQSLTSALQSSITP